MPDSCMLATHAHTHTHTHTHIHTHAHASTHARTHTHVHTHIHTHTHARARARTHARTHTPIINNSNLDRRHWAPPLFPHSPSLPLRTPSGGCRKRGRCHSWGGWGGPGNTGWSGYSCQGNDKRSRSLFPSTADGVSRPSFPLWLSLRRQFVGLIDWWSLI